MSAVQERIVALQADRRQLLEYALEVQPDRDVHIQLPIGMERPEPWLLDALDAGLLLRALRAPPPGSAPIELVLYCMQGARSATAEDVAPGRHKLCGSSSRHRGSRSHGFMSDDGDGGGLGSLEEEPELSIPQLATGLKEAEIKDLAYLIVAATCRDEAASELLLTVRSQLDVDGERAEEVERLMRLVESNIARTKADKGVLPVSDTWSGSLELVLVLLETVLPKDFKRFKSFVIWRDTLHNALLQTLLQGVRDSWQPPQQQDGPAPSAQQLLARLKGSLRRCDVRCADDFDEREYREATHTLGRTTLDLVKCLGTGWRFPWGLRVRVCEMLLRGVFDTLEEGTYMQEADQYLQLLQSRVWPLLGVSSSMHNSCFAWIHFREFVITKTPALVGSAKALLRRLAQLSAARRAAQQPESGAGVRNGARPPADAATEDVSLTREVGACIIDWVGERLSDYHRRAKPLGGPKVLAGLVDVMAFAAQSRGDSQEAVGDMLIAAILSSVEKELKRRVDKDAPYSSDAAELAAMIKAAQSIAEEEIDDGWCAAFTNQLPEAPGIATARLHSLLGARYHPFLGCMTLEPEALEVIRLALDIEPTLLVPAANLVAGCTHPQAKRILTGARSWGTLAQLQPVLARWVAAQASAFNVWVARQLDVEDWKPLGHEQPHSQSARELGRMVMESLDALFGMGIPLPAESVAMLLEALEGVYASYLKLVRQKLGPWQRMLPPLPPLVRYKREISAKQEEAEKGLPGLPTRMPPVGTKKWLETVPRVEAEPVCSSVEPLTPRVVAVMLCSLAYLEATLQPIAASVSQRWRDAARIGGAGRPAEAAAGAPSGSASRQLNNGQQPQQQPPPQQPPQPPAQQPRRHRKLSAENLLNPFLASPRNRGDDNPFLSGNSTPTAAAAASGGSGGGAAANPFDPRAAATAGTDGSLGSADGVHGSAGSFTRTLLRADSGGRSAGTLSGGGGAAEMLGSLLEGASQMLRHGIGAVCKWLAVRVVWWDMRAEWCELLYRHRVSDENRVDFIVRRLAKELESLAELLPEKERLEVALALLKEVASSLERVLLDGGPARLFVPVDVDLLSSDLAALKQLFHADGDGLDWQDVDSALAAVTTILAVMETPTPALVQRHTQLRRQALMAAGITSGRNPSPLNSPRFGFGQAAFANASPHQQQQPPGAQQQQQQQSQPGSRLSTVSNVSSVGASGAAAAAAAQPVGQQPMAPLRLGLVGAGVPGDATPTGGRTPRLDLSGWRPGHRRTSSAGNGINGTAPLPGMFGAGAMGLVPVGELANNEQVLLRVLCHRADHTASKYLKEIVKVPKLREETIKEAVNRITTKIL